jgi:2-polyprenyl-6-methoxyphenol hydroxylase-like FAD-dependent oxidoreductase
MRIPPLKIAVVGASLGGLSAANVLRQLGFDAQVYELFAKGFDKRGGALGSVDLGLLRRIRLGNPDSADRAIKGHGHFTATCGITSFKGCHLKACILVPTSKRLPMHAAIGPRS